MFSYIIYITITYSIIYIIFTIVIADDSSTIRLLTIRVRIVYIRYSYESFTVDSHKNRLWMDDLRKNRLWTICVRIVYGRFAQESFTNDSHKNRLRTIRLRIVSWDQDRYNKNRSLNMFSYIILLYIIYIISTIANADDSHKALNLNF